MNVTFDVADAGAGVVACAAAGDGAIGVGVGVIGIVDVGKGSQSFMRSSIYVHASRTNRVGLLIISTIYFIED